MTDLTITDAPAGPPDTVKAHVRMPDGRRAQITRKQKIACDATVWRGATMQEAAAEAGLTTDAVRKAFGTPHVQRYLREQRQVFRENARAQNIHHAVQVRGQTDNQTARIQAIRYLDGIGESEGQREGARQVTPGVVVTVNVNRGPAEVDQTLIEVNPAASQAADEQGENGGSQP